MTNLMQKWIRIKLMILSAIDPSNACKLAVHYCKRDRNLNSKQEEIQSFVTFNLSPKSFIPTC